MVTCWKQVRAKQKDNNLLEIIEQEIKKANKSERWMPRLWEAMKDVISCDKLGGGANNL